MYKFNINDKTVEVVIKTHSCPINPLDINKMTNLIPLPKYPGILGSECSGTIVEAQNKSLIGKSVSAFVPEGSYQSMHFLKSLEYTIIHDNKVDLNSASCGFVNPVTCLGLISHVESSGEKAGIINLASNSALGRMISRVATYKGFYVINVVRSKKAKEGLQKAEGNVSNLLVMEDDNFIDVLKGSARDLNGLFCFDPIGGELTGKILKVLPANSKIIVYGTLARKNIECVDGADLRFNNKGIIGFALFNWFPRLSTEEKQKYKENVSKNLGLFKTNIKNTYNIEDYSEAVQEYLRDMSSGKILLKF